MLPLRGQGVSGVIARGQGEGSGSGGRGTSQANHGAACSLCCLPPSLQSWAFHKSPPADFYDPLNWSSDEWSTYLEDYVLESAIFSLVLLGIAIATLAAIVTWCAQPVELRVGSPAARTEHSEHLCSSTAVPLLCVVVLQLAGPQTHADILMHACMDVCMKGRGREVCIGGGAAPVAAVCVMDPWCLWTRP